MMLALTSYGVFLALHIMAAVVAFGFSLAAPLYVPYVRRSHPRTLPALHDVQYMMETRVTGPGITLLFLFGAYLASKNDSWDQSWVQVPITIFVVIAIVGVWIVKTIKRMAALARADLDVAGDGNGTVTLSAEYEQLYGRYLIAQSLLCVLVLVAVFFMAAKP